MKWGACLIVAITLYCCHRSYHCMMKVLGVSELKGFFRVRAQIQKTSGGVSKLQPRTVLAALPG